jgi:hypothetical protein
MDSVYTSIYEEPNEYDFQKILDNGRGAHGGAVGSGTALQAGRSQVQSLEFFIDIIFPAALWTWG